ncbi:MAG: 1-acyl-sn-glycerol-3-phosphate acyltransferase [Sedimentisphaerales bacterium]|nr:1-acyl-sn-glycerol-3-phosphate acyltransferase [Sedimentisphaerales bacterium]
MINMFWIILVKILLKLRYRIRLSGVDEVVQKNYKGILFLPNHPALIDPVILMDYLYGPFRARPLADRDRMKTFLIGYLARRIRVLTLPDVKGKDISLTAQVREVIHCCVEALQAGDNLVIYPGGRVYRSRLEHIGSNSIVQRILKELPEVPIVLVRIKGLWGSRFSWASGQEPSIAETLKFAVRSLLLSGIFFAPRRVVDIELTIPQDFPRTGTRREINTYLENFYNHEPQHDNQVPYTPWS